MCENYFEGIILQYKAETKTAKAFSIRRLFTYCQIRGAGNETRTRDLNLGKVALYQLSYSRVVKTGAIIATFRISSIPIDIQIGYLFQFYFPFNLGHAAFK
jgi:hypothetical protein